MNTNSIKSSLAFILAVTLLSSCGSLSVSKKRYSRGLNIDWFSSKDDAGNSQPVKKERISKSVQNNTMANAGTVTVGKGLPVYSETEPFESMSEELAFTAKKPLVDLKEFKRNISNKRVTKKHSYLQKMALKKAGRVISKQAVVSPQTRNVSDAGHGSHDADTNLILLVILALLLPPLAIFLYFGELEVHFLINILLILLGGGLWLASGGLSYVGLAVIHALLVVFGIFG